jgi:SAM-dependent methyltransferase
MDWNDLSFDELRDLSEGMVTVAAAVDAGIFAELGRKPAGAPELAARLDLDERAVGVVLPVLAQLGFLERDGSHRYHLTSRPEGELADPESPDYQGGGMPLWLENLRAWTRLPRVLREGGPVDRVLEEEPDDDTRRLPRFMAGMAAAPRSRVERLVDGVLERHPGPRTLLDLGGGPGHISRAFVDRGLEVTMLDLPETVEFVREAYALDRVDGLRTVAGDFLEDPLPPGPFDAVLLSNILHMLSPDECGRLIRKVADVTAPGGVVGVADFVRGRSPRAVRFAVVMLLRTEGGDTYTLDDHRQWFRAAGFGEMQVTDLDPDRQLLTVLRDGAD